MLIEEIREHLTEHLIPFWKGLRDNEYGGYYGWLGYDLKLDKKAVKGCILNSRILWFFSSACRLLGDAFLLAEADHAYEFMQRYCLDKRNGGVYWSVTYDGNVEEDLKHTYNQAFAIYALSAYYRVSKKEEALKTAQELFALIEEKCRDEQGYLEAFTEDFLPADNEKLSENGVLAEKTMNTLLHVFEAYTELYDVTHDAAVAERLQWMMNIFRKRVYNPEEHRLEVFFDKDWNSLLDLHSFGHDIEAAWLIDRGCEVLGDAAYTEKMHAITKELESCVFEKAYRSHSLANEAENGIIDETRVWWVQAEAMVGYTNAWQKEKAVNGCANAWQKDGEMPGGADYRQAVDEIWDYIKTNIIGKRPSSEWFWCVHADGSPVEGRPIVEPWKCPYHNGRMCIEMIRRLSDAS